MEYASHAAQPRRSLALPLMAAAVLGAGLATATFALVNIEDEPIVSLPTPAEEPATVTGGAVAGQRSDGGPEEGTAQSVTAQPAASSTSTGPGVRYDGGPEEGTRGVAVGLQASGASAAGIRYDGGPEEGTRGAATGEQSSGESSGPVQFSGARP